MNTTDSVVHEPTVNDLTGTTEKLYRTAVTEFADYDAIVVHGAAPDGLPAVGYKIVYRKAGEYVVRTFFAADAFVTEADAVKELLGHWSAIGLENKTVFRGAL